MNRWDNVTHTFDWMDKIEEHAIEMQCAKRNFVWYSTDTAEDKKEIIQYLKDCNIKIMTGLPFWFVVGYRKCVPKKDVDKMRKLITPKESKSNIIWKGKQFGYSAKQINFYLKQVY